MPTFIDVALCAIVFGAAGVSTWSVASVRVFRAHRSLPLAVLTALVLAACTGTRELDEAIGKRTDALSTITTDKSAYLSTDAVHAIFTGASGSANDWVSISVPGSPATSYLLWSYIGAAVTSGTTTFSGVSSGTYVARLHPAGSYTISAESVSFTTAASASTITTDASSYASGANVTVTFTGSPGWPNDWVSISVPGSTSDSYLSYEYIGGHTSGTRIFTNVPAGTYVARLHADGSYTTLVESASFTMAAGQTSATPASTSFASGSAITVTVSGMPGAMNDWVGLSAPGAPNYSVVGWSYTAGVSSGDITISTVPDGTYVARAHPAGSYSVLNESASFNVGGAGIAPTLSSFPGPANYSVLAVGAFHTCAIGTDGTLWCWGTNTYGEIGDGSSTDHNRPTKVGTGTTWKSVTAGAFHTCATQTNNTLWCWGYNGNGQLGDGTTTDRYAPVQIGAGTTWSKLSAGSYHTCGTLSTGTLWCWGYNANSQLGDGTTTQQSAPLQIGSATTWSTVSSGWLHTCATQTGGTLWCWGYNATSQLGDGTTTQRAAPTQIGALTTWNGVSAGHDHSCGTKTNGTVWCWGANGNGQVGDGTTTARTAPVQTGSATTWSTLAVGAYHACGTQSDRSVWCWGYNANGQLADATTTDRSSPTLTSLSASAVAPGWSHVCALQSSGALYCWGDNASSQVGDGTLTERHAPTKIGSAGTQGWSEVRTSGTSVCGVTLSHNAYCWGANAGNIGDGTTTDRHAPTRAGATSDWAHIAPGFTHTCALKTDSSLWCWGDDVYGELADNTTTGSTKAPTSKLGTSTWNMPLRLGFQYSSMVRSDGTLWSWGTNANGRLGDGTTTQRNVVTQIGAATSWAMVAPSNYDFTCGITTANWLYCWGDNGFGNLGINSTTEQHSPTRVGAGTTWTQAATGFFHACGVQSNGTLWCWGDNSYGELGLGSTTQQNAPAQVGALTTWKKVSNGDYHTCALKTDGTVWCWGSNTNGQIGDGTTTQRNAPVQVGTATSWTDVMAGSSISCAQKSDLSLWCWGFNDYGQLGDGTTTQRTSPQQVPFPSGG